ncbi:hypothetical protein DID74_00475 [Candidatus Marinamargulisbacteria bacterium SCGC AG-333-B06]|nr:hypothetical protein DID74_00475 [Candidatus Marinamargulisbacteria bacterium SCGC AG-333-B06]
MDIHQERFNSLIRGMMRQPQEGSLRPSDRSSTIASSQFQHPIAPPMREQAPQNSSLRHNGNDIWKPFIDVPPPLSLETTANMPFLITDQGYQLNSNRPAIYADVLEAPSQRERSDQAAIASKDSKEPVRLDPKLLKRIPLGWIVNMKLLKQLITKDKKSMTYFSKPVVTEDGQILERYLLNPSINTVIDITIFKKIETHINTIEGLNKDNDREKYIDCLKDIIKLFVCPISLEIIINPIIFSDGHMYEKESIKQWVEKPRDESELVSSPMTNQAILGPVLHINSDTISAVLQHIKKIAEQTSLDIEAILEEEGS